MNEINMSEVVINGKTYVEKGSEQTPALLKDGMKYVIIRADRAGVFAGYLEAVADTVSGRVVIMRECRRLWYWSGAASLSQLSIDGTKKPGDCKFPEAMSRAEISGVIEVLDCTSKAKASIQGVKIWQQ